MTPEGTIKQLKEYILGMNYMDDEAVWMAIKALKALEQEPCEDCISREAVDEYITNLLSGYLYDEERTRLEDLTAHIWELPSIQPTRPTGKWFIDERPESNREVVCSNCDQPIFKYHKLDFDYRPKYCPNCGAKMAESEDKE